MKFPSRKITLPADMGTNNAGEALFVVVKTAVTEGQIRSLRKLQADEATRILALPKDEQNPLDASRVGNAEILKMVEEWNFDDEAGTVLPLMSTVLNGKALNQVNGKVAAQASHILEELPIAFFGWLGRVVVGGETSERTQGF